MRSIEILPTQGTQNNYKGKMDKVKELRDEFLITVDNKAIYLLRIIVLLALYYSFEGQKNLLFRSLCGYKHCKKSYLI